MAKFPICPYCKQAVDIKNQPSKKYKEKTYHLSCYKQMCDEAYKVEKKRSGISAPSFSEQTVEKTPQELLEEYICKIFRINELTPFLRNQLVKISTENPKFTYDGMRASLIYYVEIQQKDADIKYGIGIIPYIYEEARGFFEKKKKINADTQRKEIKKTIQNVKIKPKKRENKVLVDISKL